MVLILCRSFPGGQPRKLRRSIAIPLKKQDAFGLKGGKTHQALIEHRVLTPCHSSLVPMENLAQELSLIRSHFVRTCGCKGLRILFMVARGSRRPVQSCTRWCPSVWWYFYAMKDAHRRGLCKKWRIGVPASTKNHLDLVEASFITG